MAPKKKPGAAAHPSTSKAPPPAAADATLNAEVHEDVGAAGDMVGAGGVITTSPAAEAEREAPEKSYTNNIPVPTLCEVCVEILFRLSLLARPRGIARAVMLILRRITILWPLPTWVQS